MYRHDANATSSCIVTLIGSTMPKIDHISIAYQLLEPKNAPQHACTLGPRGPDAGLSFVANCTRLRSVCHSCESNEPDTEVTNTQGTDRACSKI
jgi:hypothetical protein